MPQNKNNDFDADAVLQKQVEINENLTKLDKILNDRSKLAEEKIIDVLDNGVKTQESVGKIIEKYDKKQCRVFLKNWGNKLGFGLWTLITIIATAYITAHVQNLFIK